MMASNKGKKNKGGRPRIIIDWAVVDGMLALQATGEEISAHLGYSYDTLERACKKVKKEGFAEYSRKKRKVGHLSLRRQQFKVAMDGNPTLLIWLGKNYLGQADKQEIKHSSDEAPLEGMQDWYSSREEQAELHQQTTDRLVKAGILPPEKEPSG